MASKSIHSLFFACLIASLFPAVAHGQWLYGVSNDRDSIWAVDTTTWAMAQRKRLTIPGDSILGSQGLAYDHIGHQTYLLLRTLSQSSNSLLASVNLLNGTCTPIGRLGDDFRAIAFREDGQMLGIVGDGGTQPESLFLINKSSGSKSLATALGNGDNGEAMAFRFDDGQIYHWSGSNNLICERLPSTTPFSPISPINISGSPATEVGSALYLGGGNFLLCHTDGSLSRQNATGLQSPVGANAPVPFSGIAMPPRFKLAYSSICLSDPAEVLFSGLVTDTVIYDWGDSTFTTVFPAGPASHYYPSNAYYTIKVALKNPVAGADTIASLVIWVIHLPPVSIYPGNDTVICDVDTVLLTGAFGGTSQWYRNGQPIPGANNYQYIATQNGWYNMTKRNQLGCRDSAHVGVAIGFANQSSPVIEMDTSGCPTVIFDASTPVAHSWLWSFGDGSTSAAASPSHTYASIGNYNVNLTVTNECGTYSGAATAVVDCPIGMEDASDIRMDVFPNPSNGTFYLMFADAKPAHLTVRDLNGRLILNEMRRGESLGRPFNLVAPAGAYLLRVETGNKVFNRMLILE